MQQQSLTSVLRVCVGQYAKKKKQQTGKRKALGKAAAWKQAYHAVMPVSC
jgi:predicted DNA-binding ribbon-helix-helix protein